MLALGGYAAYLFLTWWLLTHRIDRFWLPLLPCLAILAGLGADWSERLVVEDPPRDNSRHRPGRQLHRLHNRPDRSQRVDGEPGLPPPRCTPPAQSPPCRHRHGFFPLTREFCSSARRRCSTSAMRSSTTPFSIPRPSSSWPRAKVPRSSIKPSRIAASRTFTSTGKRSTGIALRGATVSPTS